jgi:hypothetical protein
VHVLVADVPGRIVELHTDLLIRTHLALLYDTLLEQNLVRVIEPYSVVELSYVANQVGQPLNSVESKYVQAGLPDADTDNILGGQVEPDDLGWRIPRRTGPGEGKVDRV